VSKDTLKEYERGVLSRLIDEYGLKRVNTDTPGQFRSPCPAHGGEDLSMVTYLDKDVIRFNCFSHRCHQDDIRDALGLKDSDLRAPVTTGCSLDEYASHKRLDPFMLSGFGLQDCKHGSKPAVAIPYWDSNQKKIATRYRVSIDGNVKVKAQRGSPVSLYGLWRFDPEVEPEYIVIVEGESDCHTLWTHGIPAIGIPGAQQVNLVLPQLTELVSQYPDAKLYVVEEPDAGGRTFVRLFDRQSFKERINVVRLDGFKDPSELHCDNPVKFDKRWDKAIAQSISLVDAVVEQGINDLGDLKIEIEKILADSSIRSAKHQVVQVITDLLLKQSRLLCEDNKDSGPYAYMLVNDAVVPLREDSTQVRHAIHDAGINPKDSIFGWLIEEIGHRAVREGRKVDLHRFSVSRGNKLYISSGSSSLVVVMENEHDELILEKQQNGYDGILFSADSSFAEWEPEDSLFPTGIPALRPCVEDQPEVNGYSPTVQRNLMCAWLAGILRSAQLPILSAIGGRGSGKSLLAKAIVKLFLGEQEQLSQTPSDAKAFYAAATSLPIYAIDNLDTSPPSWMEDAFAASATGVGLTTRTLYTTNKTTRKEVSAKFVVTTRTAEFAKRKDITDRILPMFFGSMPHEEREEENTLLTKVADSRNSIMSYLASVAYRSIYNRASTKGLPTRFQTFATLVLHLYGGDHKKAHGALEALERAQHFAIHEPDRLTKALMDYRGGEIYGSATAIIEKLKRAGYKGLPFGGGKHLAKILRECRRTLELGGYELYEQPRSGTTYFRLAKK